MDPVFVFLLALSKIIVVNLVLSGDNAVVIALACRNLEKRHRNIAILWGTGGAVVLRIALTVVAVLLLQVPYLQFAGGLLLVWISVQLLIEDDSGEGIHAHTTLAAAIRTIIIADLVMSLDNTLAIAAVAEGDLVLLCLGLALSIPIIVFGSTLIMKLMEKLPVIVYLGAGLIAWTAGEMMTRDEQASAWFPQLVRDWSDRLLPAAVTLLVVGGGFLYNRVKSRKAADVLAADEHEAERLEEKLK